MQKATDALIKNTFEKRLKDAQRVTTEFKAAQVTSGASGVLAYDVVNSGDWDLTGTLPYVDATNDSGLATFSITFTGDGSQQWPFCLISIDMRIDGTATSNQMTYSAASNLWTYGTYPSDFIACTYFGVFDQSAFNTSYKQSWIIQGTYGFSPAYYIKIRGQATCPGTFNLTVASS